MEGEREIGREREGESITMPNKQSLNRTCNVLSPLLDRKEKQEVIRDKNNK